MFYLGSSFGFSLESYMMYIGMINISICLLFVYLLIIPGFIEVLIIYYPLKSQKILGDVSSTLYSASGSLGKFIISKLEGMVVD